MYPSDRRSSEVVPATRRVEPSVDPRGLVARLGGVRPSAPQPDRWRSENTGLFARTLAREVYSGTCWPGVLPPDRLLCPPGTGGVPAGFTISSGGPPFLRQFHRPLDALEALLAGGGAQLSCVDAAATSPTVAISSDASAPVTGPFSITIAFSEPVTGFGLDDLVVENGSASELQGTNASYTATITPAASGAVTLDIAAGAAQDSAGNPSAAAHQFSIVADLTPVPALPVAGVIALAVLLVVGGAARVAERAVRPRAGATGPVEHSLFGWWVYEPHVRLLQTRVRDDRLRRQ